MRLSDEQLKEILSLAESADHLGGYAPDQITQSTTYYAFAEKATPAACAALVQEVIRLRELTKPKPLPKAGECIGRFGSNSDECTKCGLRRKDHK